MADKTGISWTDATWNPVRGCSRVSEGCRNCYAERVAARFSGPGQPYEGLVRLARVPASPASRSTDSTREPRWTGDVRLIAEHLADPLRWKKPRRIFVNSMSDLFHEKLTNEQVAAVFGVMAAAPQHTFQVLTKRARRMREWFEWARGAFTEQQRGIVQAPHTFRAMLDAAFEELGKPHKPVLDAAWRANENDVWPLPNVWLGVSVEDQASADERIPELLATPAAVRFLSCEPLIGPVRLDDIGKGWSSLARTFAASMTPRGERVGIDWVIAGCESGPRARACSVEWLRSLRDQCAAADVPFFLKQAAPGLGGLAYDVPEPKPINIGRGSKWKPGAVIELPYLDGEQHAAFPEV